jgi:hypothetical protein
MKGLHYQLKQRIKHGAIKLNELKPNSMELARRLLAEGVLYKDQNGFLKVSEVL